MNSVMILFSEGHWCILSSVYQKLQLSDSLSKGWIDFIVSRAIPLGISQVSHQFNWKEKWIKPKLGAEQLHLW